MSEFIPRPFEEIVAQAQMLGFKGKTLKKFIEAQQKIDSDRLTREAEERRHIREMEDKQLARQHEMDKKDMTVNDNPQQNKQLDKNLKCMTDNEDLLFYLELFETTATANDIPKTRWPLVLTHKLNEKLKLFMIQTKLIHNTDYDFVKGELLKQAQLTEEACRTLWHELSPKTDDMKDFYVHLKRTFDNWLKTSQTPMTVDGIIDLIMRDRLYSVLSSEALKDILLRKPTSAQEVLDCIDQFRDATKGSTHIVKGSNKVTSNDIPYVAFGATGQSNSRRPNNINTEGTQVICYRCGKGGHIARWCRVKINENRGPTQQ